MIEVDLLADRPSGKVNPMIYGQMIEHAYWSVHLGLWSQLLDNGGFELDRQGVYRGVAQGWQLMTTDEGNRVTATLDDTWPFNARHSQRVWIERYRAGETRLLQDRLSVSAHENYVGSLYLRGNLDGRISVSLMSVTKHKIATQELGRVGHEDWKRYDFVLHPQETSEDASFCIALVGQGTIWIDQVQLHPSAGLGEHSLRPDILSLYRSLKPSFLRWPGGSYLIWHHWKNGIGPMEGRPYGHGRLVNPTEDGEWDPNSFGTDEFLRLSRHLGAEPIVNINIKDGLQNTLDWLEYCNGDSATRWGSIRSRNGSRDPYGVKFWIIDNEPLDTPRDKGYSEEVYPVAARIWAEALKANDPSVRALVMGTETMQALLGTPHDFNLKVVQETRDVLDYLCVHFYYDQSVFAPLQGTAYKMGEGLQRLHAAIREIAPARGVQLALTEWNPQSNAQGGGNVGQAVEAGQIFNILERMSAQGAVGMAAPCQLCVNVDRYRGSWLRAALVQINNRTSWTSPMYLANRLFAEQFQPDLFEIRANDVPLLSSEVFSGYQFPALDLISSRSPSGKRIVIKVVNADTRAEHRVRFTVHSTEVFTRMETSEIASDTLTDTNTMSEPGRVAVKTSERELAGSRFDHVFPPCSVTALVLTSPT